MTLETSIVGKGVLGCLVISSSAQAAKTDKRPMPKTFFNICRALNDSVHTKRNGIVFIVPMGK
ncbi:hypothetical protein YZOS03_13090 [Vibrio alginolyticus]|nr:hypothetical protein YZOS03_13090 [Vibrio alginolyticus]BCG17836.1 hypothetical protein HLBS07_16880 [Vibrio alginolyticus]